MRGLRCLPLVVTLLALGLPTVPAAASLPEQCLSSADVVTCTFTASTPFVVPANAVSLVVVAVGADGLPALSGTGEVLTPGGTGASLSTTLAAVAGQTLVLTVAGADGAPGGASTAAGGAGGAATTVTGPAGRLVVAAGGGGGGGAPGPSRGGDGGSASTSEGLDGETPAEGVMVGGGGQSGGHGGAGGPGGQPGSTGTASGAGGAGAPSAGEGGSGGGGGGGGGAGYRGGGGGGSGAGTGAGGGGGAGSSYAAGALDALTAGDGHPRIVITFVQGPDAPTLSGPTAAPRGSTPTLTGHAAAHAPVQVWLRKQGTSAFLLASSVTTDALGGFSSRYLADVDAEYYATAGGVRSATSATRAVGTTLTGPHLVRRGTTVALNGLARPGQRVDVLFRSHGQTTFTDQRDLNPSGDGSWRTTFLADRDYAIYARTTEAPSSQVVTLVAFATISGPARVAPRATVTLRGTARPGSTVTVWTRREGTRAFVLRRTLLATGAGTFAVNYTADAGYAYFAVADSVRSTTRATTILAPPAQQSRTSSITAADRARIRNGFNPSSQVRLSFDDCATPTTLTRLLALLSRDNVQADFFFTGQCLAAHPDYRALLVAGNQLLGNHSFDHTDYRSLSDAQIRSQLLRGVRPTTTPALARPPYGDLAFTVRFWNVAASVGMRPAFWSVDSRDWAHYSAARITRRVLVGEGGPTGTPPARAGGLVLMHGTGDHTLEALPAIISGLRAQHLALFAIR